MTKNKKAHEFAFGGSEEQAKETGLKMLTKGRLKDLKKDYEGAQLRYLCLKTDKTGKPIKN